MSQWGEYRILLDGRVKAIPDLTTHSFDPATTGSLITQVVLVNVTAIDGATLADLADSINREWVGKPYSEWLALPKEKEHGI